MPNWCDNEIEIHSKKPDVLRAIESLIDVAEPFEAILPLPPGIDDQGAYDWRVNNWGTKWEPEGWCIDASDADGGGLLRVRCSTAWSPPVDVLRHLSGRFPDAVIVVLYEEQGMAFTGGAVLHAGACVSEEHRDMENDDWSTITDDDGNEKDNPDFVPLYDRFPGIDDAGARALNPPPPPPPPPREYPPEDTDEARAERRRAARAALADSTTTPNNGGTP